MTKEQLVALIAGATSDDLYDLADEAKAQGHDYLMKMIGNYAYHVEQREDAQAEDIAEGPTLTVTSPYPVEVSVEETKDHGVTYNVVATAKGGWHGK